MNEQKSTSVVPEAVRQLLEQRSTYREWLSRLDEVGGKYRSEVAERVRVDYESRLDGVGDELAEHRHELVASLERRRGRLGELTEAFERHSAELEEAELRFQVGEFDDATWEKTRANLAESIEEIEGELDDARSAVGALERVLGELGGGNGVETAPDLGRAPAPVGSKARRASGVSDTGGATDASPPADPPETEASAAPGAEVSTETAAAADVGADESGEADAAALAPADDAAAALAPADADVAARGKDAPDDTEDEAEVTADAEVAASVGSAAERTTDGPDGGSEDYLDELEFLESLSLDDPDSFDAVSRMLEDEEDR